MTIQQWIDALLSGEFKQGKGRLRTGDSFCCLGVACAVKDNTKWVQYATEKGEPTYHWENAEYTHFLPMSLMKELGLTGEIQDRLVCMNDNGKTFIEIAKQIKEYAEEGAIGGDHVSLLHK